MFRPRGTFSFWNVRSYCACFDLWTFWNVLCLIVLVFDLWTFWKVGRFLWFWKGIFWDLFCSCRKKEVLHKKTNTDRRKSLLFLWFCEEKAYQRLLRIILIDNTVIFQIFGDEGGLLQSSIIFWFLCPWFYWYSRNTLPDGLYGATLWWTGQRSTACVIAA